MNNSSDSSFSFRKKRHEEFNFPIQPHKKARLNTTRKAVLHLKTLGIPLVSSSTGQFCDSLCLEPYIPFTVGRERKLCDFVFPDRRVSKQHFQLLYDSLKNKIYLSDGLFVNCSDYCNSFSSVSTRVSLNGAFVNWVRINGVVELCVGDVVGLVCGNEGICGLSSSIGFLVEKFVFTEEIDNQSLIRFGSSSVHTELTSSLEFCRVVNNTSVLLSWCRDILCNDDPVSYIQKRVALDQYKKIVCASKFDCKKGFELFPNNGLKIECRNRKRVYSREVENDRCYGKSLKEIIVVSEENTDFRCSNAEMINPTDGATIDIEHDVTASGICADLSLGKREVEVVDKCNSKSLKEIVVVSDDENTDFRFSNVALNAETTKQTDSGGANIGHDVCASVMCDDLSLVKQDYNLQREILEDENSGCCIMPPRRKFYLNRLQDVEEIDDVVSLPQLFHPVESLKRVFIATFTSDMSWFLSYCKIPHHLPVTIACHSAERCWSLDPDKRTSVPFPDFPNLTVVYPLFPEVIAFNKDRKNSGIGCHHPKLIVLQREDNLRVIVTSANLVARQWHNVTNTVWWQDFPRLSIPNCFSLFTRLSMGEINIDSNNDFAAQLAGFMASLVADVPSQAHWVLELMKYDFRGAVGYLVASVPGIHSHRSPCVSESKSHLVGNRGKLESRGLKLLASVEASVVGLSHIYRVSSDSSGAQLKKLALFLGKCQENMDGLLEIVLRRDMNIPADRNAVSILVPNPEEFSGEDFVQLGFLPRHVAKWVAPLSDIGLFAFSAYIYPKEVLATALEGSNNKVKLILYVYEGPSLSDISEVTQLEYVSAVCSLVASSQRNAGLWRLNEILVQYKWPEHLGSELFFGSSSVGSVNTQFLAAFSAAAGKRSTSFVDSEESDPDWGCWSASQELKNPSVSIIFPTIERVKNNRNGIMASRRLLCFSQKTWQRLKNVGIVHDAIPYPSDRVGFPMHVKVGCRRFKSKNGSSCGWVYCGSHNFSAAAWGRPISDSQSDKKSGNNCVLGSRLHISNYELGIVFVVPPPDDCVGQINTGGNLDDIILPFIVPPPKYRSGDRPATAQAMREAALNDLIQQQQELETTNEPFSANAASDDELMMQEKEVPEEEEDEDVLESARFVATLEKEENAYADKLWSQVDS